LNIKDKENVQVVVVGPPIMMKFAVAEFLKLGIKEENIWISQERKMCCGLGKCGHCKIDDTYICLEGPVFNYVKGKTLID
ncbi:anaerobic sulfite reductase subunit B, partial [Clostridium botulinum CFSAN001627]